MMCDNHKWMHLEAARGRDSNLMPKASPSLPSGRGKALAPRTTRP